MHPTLTQTRQNLDSIRKFENDVEFWSARDLMSVLGYLKWQKFIEVIEKSRIACKTSEQDSQYHFTHVGKMVLTGSGASRVIDDFTLTRYACYLIAQNGDPRKIQIALAQTYFATQARKQELLEQREKEDKRLISREKLKKTENTIESTVYERGIKLRVEFGTFKNKHIEALYGGISISQLKKKKSIPQSRALADFDTELELKAKDFSLALADYKIKEKNLKGLPQLTNEVVQAGKGTRKTLLAQGVKPEKLKPEEDLKKILSRRKKNIETNKIKRI
jgi:DNA-damage-inducible protein D